MAESPDADAGGQENPSPPGRARDAERPSSRALAWTTTAYFGEGLPYSVLHQLFTEHLTAIGATAIEIGYTSSFHGTIVLKPAASPLIDARGARRATMITTQLAIGAAILLSAGTVLETAADRSAAATMGLWGSFAVVALLHAVHDVACDGYFIVALDARAQALYAGTRIAAYRAAMYVGGSLLVILAARASWQLAFLVAGGLMLATGAINGILVPAIHEPRPEGRSLRKTFFSTYRDLLSQPGIGLVLALVLTYRLGDVMTFAMSSVLLRDLQMGTEDRAWLRAIGLVASAGGAIAAGVLLRQGGLERWLRPFTYLMALPFYLLLALTRPGFVWIAVVVAIEQLFGALAGTALPVYLIHRSRRSAASAHYGAFTALTALASTAVGAASGHLDVAVGHPIYFALCFVASVPALILVRWVPLDPLDATRSA